MKTLLKTLAIVLTIASAVNASAQPPAMSSYPQADAVIFLDFDGHTVEGTAWNYNGPIVCAPPALTQSKMKEIFNRVAEDYRPFNINITTDSAKFLAAPVDQRIRVILTVSSSWYGSAGGVAFVNSFSSGDDTPCFIFTTLLSNNVKYISEATSHEAGHTLGLYHQSAYDSDCNKLTDYYQGTGSGEIGWAPIMGVGYYRNFTLWNNGPNPYGCTSMQSDLDVITSATNGFGYRDDDHGNSFTSASLASLSNNQFNITGVIEKNTDSDWFRFTLPANGRFQLEATPYNVGTGNAGSNLDLQVTLYNASEQVLNVYNPGTLLSSVVDTILTAGSYYARIEGKGNAFAPSYASLGSYSLLATSSPGAVLAVHQLELRGLLNGLQHELSWTLEADEVVIEQSLQVARDGRNFETLVNVPVEEQSYSYRPEIAGTAQYRLKVIFENGRQYYTNVVSIRQDPAIRPSLIGTITYTNAVMVTSPGVFAYSIHDLSGRTIANGHLRNGVNQIKFQNISPGIYLIRYQGKNAYWSEKFLAH